MPCALLMVDAFAMVATNMRWGLSLVELMNPSRLIHSLLQTARRALL